MRKREPQLQFVRPASQARAQSVRRWGFFWYGVLVCIVCALAFALPLLLTGCGRPQATKEQVRDCEAAGKVAVEANGCRYLGGGCIPVESANGDVQCSVKQDCNGVVSQVPHFCWLVTP